MSPLIHVVGDTEVYNTTTSGVDVYDVSGVSHLSSHHIVAVTGTSKEANLELYKSNDSFNWVLIETASGTTSNINYFFEKVDPTYHYFKTAVDVVGGGADVTRSVVGKGPA